MECAREERSHDEIVLEKEMNNIRNQHITNQVINCFRDEIDPEKLCLVITTSPDDSSSKSRDDKRCPNHQYIAIDHSGGKTTLCSIIHHHDDK